MLNRKGRIFVVSGPSGVGKSTILGMFLKEDRESLFSISFTTRKKRVDEVNGRDYYFVSEELFSEMVKKDLFLEWEEVHGNFYGTPKDQILKAKREGKDIFLDIDVKGALKVKEKCREAILIFIMPPSKESLFDRLLKRGEKEIEKRMRRFEEEVEKKDLFDYIIINDNLEKAYIEFKNLVSGIRRENGKDHG